ncbi:MAG: SRPBCC family protein [Solirubrobacteraceae bacterium]
MKPIVVSTHIDKPREEVFAFLDVMANHEPFTNHMLVDWTYSGPATGVGAKARMRANVPGPKDWADMEVVSATPPTTIVEQAVGANGKRRTQGTYTLSDSPGGGTDVRFELRYLQTPGIEKVLSPVLRIWLQRGNQKAMDRLAATRF